MSKSSDPETGNDEFQPKHLANAAQRNLLYDGNNLPYNPDLLQHAKDLRKRATPEERILWNFLKTLPFRVLRQRPIDHYIVDFYIPEKHLVIEIDGGQHFTEVGKTMDDKRTAILESYDLKVVRFTNLDIRNNIAGVCTAILEQLK